MKTIHFKILLLLLGSVSYQSQNFTWMRGSNFSGTITGVYGTQSVPSSSNTPGSRHGAATWTDASGNLWLFGGEGISATPTLSWLSDLWKYNPTTNQWTWIKGSNSPNQIGTFGTQGTASSANNPGAREFAMSWIDASGNFWLFGGDGFASTSTFGRLNDLWKYNPSSNQWTWVNGTNTINQMGTYGTINVSSTLNQPGARYGAAALVDPSGNFWLFGGLGFATTPIDGRLSDLWKYNPSLNQWTWMHGPNINNQLATFGTLSVPSTTNNPGGKEFPSYWADASNNLYFFGGRGYTSSTNMGYLNDFWKYNITADTWTWIGGSNANNGLGTYGTLGVYSPSNIPGGRYTCGIWKDTQGIFWLFGGTGWPSISNLTSLNDVWKFDPAINQWAWMKGASSVPNSPGIYGTQTVANVNNIPGARHYNTSWRNASSAFWIFGGEGIDTSSNNQINNMNDLWGLVPPCNPDSINSTSGNLFCSNGTATLIANNQYPANVTWYSSATSTISIGTGSTLVTSSLTALANPSVYTFYAQSNGCTVTPKTAISITVNPMPQITFIGSNTVCSGSTLALTANGANSYTWANGATSASVVVSPVSGSSYSLIGNSFGCISTANFTVNVIPSPTVVITGTNQVCKGFTLNLSASGANTYTWSTGSNSNSITVTTTTNNLFVTLNGEDQFGCKGNANKTINVLPLPPISVSVNPSHSICVKHTATLSVNGVNSYTWSNGSNTTIAITSSVINTFTYSVIGMDINGCINSTSVTIGFYNFECTGIDNYAAIEKIIRLYPNPNSGEFKIQNLQHLNLEINIYNQLGQFILHDEITESEKTIRNNFAKGIYFIQLSNKNRYLGSLKMVLE